MFSNEKLILRLLQQLPNASALEQEQSSAGWSMSEHRWRSVSERGARALELKLPLPHVR
jgi:hypothetical protein